MIGTTEIIIIALIIVVLFGASAIPKLAKSIGQAKGEFEKGIKDGISDNQIKSDISKFDFKSADKHNKKGKRSSK